MHLIKYRFLQLLRSRMEMFWALAFPLILGTLFYLAFGRLGLAATGDIEFAAVPVGVVTTGDDQTASAFREVLNSLDGDLLKTRSYDTAAAAEQALRSGTIKGYYTAGPRPALTVAANGIEQSILTAVLESFERSSSLLQTIAAEHPEQLDQAISRINDQTSYTREVSLGGRTFDVMVVYFFALIGYACLSGAYLGVKATNDSQANLSALGARRSVTPTHKLKLIGVDMLVVFCLHFLNLLILLLYLHFGLDIDLGDQPGRLLAVVAMGCVIGCSLGLALGSIARLGLNARMGLTVCATLVPGFLSGLMYGDMKHIIETHVPIINRLNPAAVLSDAIYSLAVFDDPRRLGRSLLILGVMSIGLLAVAFFSIRRTRYDSI